MSKQKRIRYYTDEGLLMLSCSKCSETLPSENFGKRSRSADGFKYVCKNCRAEEYNIKRKEILASRKKYYEENKEAKKEHQKNYYNNNSEAIKKQHRAYREKNKDELYVRRKASYENNKEKISQKNLEYSKKKDEELGFGWRKFHDKTSSYIRRHKLTPQRCPICGRQSRIVAHHPSYNSFDEWKSIVFVCDNCHQDIHNGNLDCPPPVDLIELKKKGQK